MPAHVADEIDAHAPGPLVVQIAVETQGAEMAVEFSEEQWCGLPAAGVAGALAAEEDEGAVAAGAGCERGAAGGLESVGD